MKQFDLRLFEEIGGNIRRKRKRKGKGKEKEEKMILTEKTVKEKKTIYELLLRELKNCPTTFYCIFQLVWVPNSYDHHAKYQGVFP